MWTPSLTDLGTTTEFQELCFTFTYEDDPSVPVPQIYTVTLQKVEVDFQALTTISIIGNSLYGYFANVFKPTLKFATGKQELLQFSNFSDLPQNDVGNLYSYSPDARSLITFSILATATSTTDPLNIQTQTYTISLRNDYEAGKNALVYFIQNKMAQGDPPLALNPACATFR